MAALPPGLQKRRVSDRQINGRPVVVVRNFEEQTILWEAIEVSDRNFLNVEIPWVAVAAELKTYRLLHGDDVAQVGDILRITERDIIPADGIILSSSEENGKSYRRFLLADAEKYATEKTHLALLVLVFFRSRHLLH